MLRAALLSSFIVAFVAVLPSARAGDKAGCADPAWASARLPGYRLDSCETKPFAAIRVNLAKGGSKTLLGEVTTTSYELEDQAKDTAANPARDHYAEAGKKAGGTIVSPEDGYRVVLEKKTGKDDVYWIYEHGSGNESSTESYTLYTVRLGPPEQFVVAKQPKDVLDTATPTKCVDPPWLVKGYRAFTLANCEAHDFDAITFDTAKGQQTIAGRMLIHSYELSDETKDPSAIAVQLNFITALQKVGAKLVSKDDDVFHAVLTQKTAKGDYWYIYEHASGNEDSTGAYTLTTVEVGGPVSKACKLEIYGVHFDTDKSELRPDSDPVLEQVLAMFKADAKLAGELSGHTDDVGDKAHNMKLSQDRADSVKAWLVAHGIDGARITTRGFGDTKPLVPNTNDQNRAKNRRTELVRNNCK